jgi:hypothetical protein
LDELMELLDFGAFGLTGSPVTFNISAASSPTGVAKIVWQAQALTSIVPAPARATFNWKV